MTTFDTVIVALYFAAVYLLSSDDDPALRTVSLRLFERLGRDR